MPYRFLDDIATADIAFEAWGPTIEEMFKAAAAAVLNVMVENPESIGPEKQKEISVQAEETEYLLFNFLQELVFYKDAENLLLRIEHISIQDQNGFLTCRAQAVGEVIDRERHKLNVDIKAVTFHRFSVQQTKRGWEATVVLDV